MKIYTTLITIALTTLLIGCGGEDSFENTAETAHNELSAVTRLNANISQDDTLEVYWDSQQNVASYLLEYGEKSTGLTESVTLNANTTRYKLDNLESDTIYLFRLTTIFTDGNKSSSDTLEVKTDTINKIIKNDTGIVQ